MKSYSVLKRSLSALMAVSLVQSTLLSSAFAQAKRNDPWGIGNGNSNGTGNGSWDPPGGSGSGGGGSWPVPPTTPSPTPSPAPNPQPAPSPTNPDPGGGWDPTPDPGGNWPNDPTSPSPLPPQVPNVPSKQDPIFTDPNGGGWGGGTGGGWGGSMGSYYCSSYGSSWGNSGWGGGGGFGGSGYSNPPGTPPPLDMNGKPIIYPACGVPAEYDCPLFESRPHDGLTQALDALSYAMSTTPECQQQQNSIAYVDANVKGIRDVLGNLQTYMNNPQMTSTDMVTFEQSITTALRAAGNLGQLFSNNSLINSQCGRQVMSGGKALLAINDILNGLAPYALMATAANPAIGGAATFAITGGAMATSAISSIVRMIEQGTVDMNNPEHRKAVLKNTCQYTKIAKKIRFMQLAQSGRINELTQELDKQVVTFKARFQQPSKDLQATLAWGSTMNTQYTNYDYLLKRDEFELSALEMQLKEAASDDLYTCLIGNEMVRRTNAINPDAINGGSFQTNTMNVGVFPASVFTNLEGIYTLRTGSSPGLGNGNGNGGGGDWSTPGTGTNSSTGTNNPPVNPTTTPAEKTAGWVSPYLFSATPNPAYNAPTTQAPVPTQELSPTSDFQVTSLKMLHDVSRRRIMSLETQVMGNDSAAIVTCAQATRSWVGGMRNAGKLSKTMLYEEQVELDQELRKNPEYATWKDQSEFIQAEEQTVSRVALVMKELAKDTSIIDRSELDQKKTLIKGALFGVRGSWKWGRSPIHEWLEHTMKLHGNRISSMDQNINSLQTAAYQLTVAKNLDTKMMTQMAARTDYQKAIANNKKAENLETLTIDRVPLGTRGHEIACQMLETTWLDWAAAIDHMGATEFMCAMIDDQIDNKVEKAIVKFCRGEIGLNSKQIENSRIQDAKAKLLSLRRYKGTFAGAENYGGATQGRSYKDWALLVAEKMNTLQCPLPPVSVMKGQ